MSQHNALLDDASITHCHMTCHNMKFAKTPLMHIKSPYFIELGITRQGSNQARSVEVRYPIPVIIAPVLAGK